MKVGASAMPRFNDSTLNPAPITPVAARILTSVTMVPPLPVCWFAFSMGCLLECQAPRSRAECAHRNDDHEHAGGYEDEYAGRAEIAQCDRDREARQDGSQAAEGIDKTDRSCTDARGVELGLIGVIRVRQHEVRNRHQGPEQDQ